MGMRTTFVVQSFEVHRKKLRGIAPFLWTAMGLG